MTRLEMVETLRDKAGVSYDEARDALEKCDWDMLDALMELKRVSNESKYQNERSKRADTAYRSEIVVDKDTRMKEIAGGIGDKISSAVRFLLSLINKGEGIRIEVLYKDTVIGSVSLTVLVLMVIFCWYVPVLLFVLGLISGYRFRFSNKSLAGKIINNINIKNEESAEREAEIIKSKYGEE